jgi:hypothetical protein
LVRGQLAAKNDNASKMKIPAAILTESFVLRKRRIRRLRMLVAR